MVVRLKENKFSLPNVVLPRDGRDCEIILQRVFKQFTEIFISHKNIKTVIFFLGNRRTGLFLKEESHLRNNIDFH